MKKNRSSLIIAAIFMLSTLLLSACSSQAKTTTTTTTKTGFFQTYFVHPFSTIIHSTAEFFGGNYGLAIIVVTLLIRLILMPLMLKQYKNQMVMKEKMDVLKPEMDAIQKKMKT